MRSNVKRRVVFIVFFLLSAFLIINVFTRSESISSKDEFYVNLVHAQGPGKDDLLFTEDEFLWLIKQRQGGVTQSYYQFNGKDIKIIYLNSVTGATDYLDVDEYRERKSQEYLAKHANPYKKRFEHSKPTLRKFPANMERPSPYLLIKTPSRSIDEVAILEELERLRNFQRFNYDDDLAALAKEVDDLRVDDSKVPNVVHYIWFNCRRFKVHHYMSMLSSLKFQNPALIFFHTNCPPNGTYWQAFSNVAGRRLRIVKRTPPVQVWNNAVNKVEHQSDVVRLHVLLEIGGIYVDDDVITLRSLDELRRTNDFVLGEENYDALANSIIMANKNSWFLKRWFQEYKTFNDSIWSESSCFVPWSMWQLFPNDIHVVKEKMLRPNWEEITYMYRELFDWSENFTVHLFSRFMPHVDGTAERTLMELAVLNTTYGEIARHVFWDSKDFHSVKEWLLQ